MNLKKIKNACWIYSLIICAVASGLGFISLGVLGLLMGLSGGFLMSFIIKKCLSKLKANLT